MQRRIVTLLFLGTLAPLTLYSECAEPCPSPSCSTIEDECMKYYSTYLTVQHVDGEGLGYCQGYTSLDALFFLYNCSECFLPLVDLRVHKFRENSCCEECSRDQEWAANAGIGFRFSSPCNRNVYGVNVFYDHRYNEAHFGQVGAGLEFLSPCFDIRLNGYYPLKEKKRVLHCDFDDFVGDFFIIQDKFKGQFRGADLEVGIPYCFNDCINFYTALGPYYYNGRRCEGNENVYGGRLRIGASICCYFNIQGIVTYDNNFRARAQAVFSFSLPLGGDCKPTFCSDPHRYQRIYRNEIIVQERFCKWKTNF